MSGALKRTERCRASVVPQTAVLRPCPVALHGDVAWPPFLLPWRIYSPRLERDGMSWNVCRARRWVVMAVTLLGALGLAAAGVVTTHGPGAGRALGRAASGQRAAAARPGGVRVGTAGWITGENRRAGTTAWHIGRSGSRHAIEGYADRVSAEAGVTVRLYVSTRARWFRVEAYRMGWYGGRRGRLVWRSGHLPGRRQASPVTDPTTNMIEARWQPSLRIRVGSGWPPGAYLLKLVAASGAERYVPLTVTDRSSSAALVLMNAVTTWQAYNDWGGRNLYWGRGGPADDARRSRVVSFDRPYATGMVDGDARRRRAGPRPRGQSGLPRRERGLPAHPPGAVAAWPRPSRGQLQVSCPRRPCLRHRPERGHHRLARAAAAPAREHAAGRAVRMQPGQGGRGGCRARVLAARRHWATGRLGAP